MALVSFLAFLRPAIGTNSNWRTWIRQTAGVIAQMEGAYYRDGERLGEDMFGYPDDLICESGYAYQNVEVPGTPNEVRYWIQIDWNSDGEWDDIYYPEIVYFTGSWSKTYTHSPETVTIGGVPSVGGFAIPVDKLDLLAPYISLASTILVATAATAIYAKRNKRKKEKQ